MDPILAGFLASLAAKGASALVGYIMSSGTEEQARDLMREASDAYGNLDESKIQAAAAKVLGPTALASIRADPSYRQAGQQALASLKNVSDSGGLTLADQAVTDKLHNETSRLASGRRAAALQQMRQRGTLDSGDELTSMLSASQEGVNRENEHDLATAGQAQGNARRAIMDRASLAGQMGDRDWRQQSDVAHAADTREATNLQRGDAAAQGQYNRDLAGLDRRYKAAGAEADYISQQGQRRAQGVAGTIDAAGDLAAGYGAQQQRTKSLGTSEEPATGGAMGDGDYYDEYGQPKKRTVAKRPEGWA